MAGVLCDTRVAPHMKEKIHKMIVQPALLYGMETVPVTSSHVKKLEATEMKMCRCAMGPHAIETIMRNENIKERLKVVSVAERFRKALLRWVGHVKRQDQDYVGRKTLEMVQPGRRKRGRPKQRWMDCVNRDMRAIGSTKYEFHDRTSWRRIVSAAATPQPSESGLKKKKSGVVWRLIERCHCLHEAVPRFIDKRRVIYPPYKFSVHFSYHLL